MAEKNKKVLIVTYYWPPSGGSGVQRWLKFVKYLPSFGWTPYVFTPENPAFDIKDESLLKDVPEEAEVLRFPIWEPYSIFFKVGKLFGSSKSAKPTELVSSRKRTLFQSVSTWIRGNLFVPDPRMFWVKPSVKFLEEFLSDNQIHTLVTTGPPHSLHLIGLNLKKKNPSLRWIADFRDPWSEWGLLDSLMTGKIARGRHRRLENAVLSNADEIVTITPFYARRFSALSNRKVNLLTNGFDEDDFKDIQYTRSEKFVIRHVGIINEKCDPRPFMNALATFANENSDAGEKIQVEFIGEVHPDFKLFVKENAYLSRVTKYYGNIPHKELLMLYGSSSLLLLVLTGYKNAEGYMPGKLFEYMATGLPILGIGPEDGDAAILLKETNTGSMIDGVDTAAIKRSIMAEFKEWNSGFPKRMLRGSGERYSRKEITRQLSEMLLR